MNTEQKNLIVTALDEYLALHNMSANDFAKKSGINSSYISNIRSGTWILKSGTKMVEIADKYFDMIAGQIGYNVEKSGWDVIPTSQFKRILATLEDAKEYGYTNVIIGETGSGKSFVSDIFARNYPLDCFVITVGSQDNITDLIEKLCERVGVPQEKTKSRTLRYVAKKLRAMRLDGHKPMIIFDEAEYMKAPALCNMKELYDSLNGICAIVLMGTEQLTRHIDKMLKKNRDGIPQLMRRIKFGIRILPTIDRTFKQFLNGLNDPALVKFLCENCNNYGELHDVLVPAMREAERTGNPLTENFIRTIFNMPKI